MCKNIKLWPADRKSGRKYAAAFLAFSCLPLVLSGCRHGGDGDVAQARLIDGVTDPSGVDIRVNDRSVWKRSAFSDDTGYQKVKPGHYQVRLQAGTLSASQEVALEKSGHYTLLALTLPDSARLALRVFPDETNAPIPDGQARVRVIDGADGAAAVDVLMNNIVAFAAVPFGQRSAPLLIKAGTYELKGNRPDTVTTLAGPSVVQFEAGRSYTVALLGRRSAGYVLKAYTDRG